MRSSSFSLAHQSMLLPLLLSMELLVSFVHVDGFAASVLTNPASKQHNCNRQKYFVGSGIRLAAKSLHSSEDDVALEHRGVPVEHQGLHNALYGDGDDHGVSEARKDLVLDDVILGTESLLLLSEGKKTAGVFSVIDQSGVVNYISFSRNLHVTIAALHSVEGSKCDRVRVQTFKFPKKDDMIEIQDKWLKELDYTPVGNTASGLNWEAAAKEVGLSSQERALREEKKFKLRKAMADSSLIDEMPQLSDEDKFRRKNLEMAVEGDDWSGEIDRQTAATTAPRAVISPFARRRSPPAAGALRGPQQAAQAPPPAASSAAADAEFSFEGVDRVLDEVRPFLMADGGNCRLLSVDAASGDVRLLLEGACGTCPSSSVTLSQGIERTLRDRFGARLGRVVQARATAGGAGGPAPATVEAVEGLLEPVRGAVEGRGGSMRVASVEAAAGLVTIEYAGPAELTYGMELYLTGVPGIRAVVFAPPPAAAAAAAQPVASRR